MSLMISLRQQRKELQAQGLMDSDLPFYLQQPDFRTGLLLLHGSAASPCNHRALGQQFFGKGYKVYAPLLAGHHDLGLLHSGAVSWQDCYQSALQALDELAQECERIFVLGSSFGGSLAYILAAKEPDKLAGLIAVSAPAQSSERWLPTEPWAQQVRAAIEAADQHLTQISLPSLILHGQDDPSVKLRHALHAFGQIPALRKKLTLYDGIGHSVGFGFNTPEVAEDVHQFIQASLPARRVRFAIADQAYRQVALAGDFNNWTVQALHRQDEEWLGELELLPGIYQYKLVIDGQHWILDPEAETLAAPHGQANSLLRI